MGNICSRSANKPDDPFARPGRPLGSSAPSAGHHHHNKPSTARLPKKQNFASPGRTLGGGQEEPGTGTDARTKAALAAQVGFLRVFCIWVDMVANDSRNEPIPRIHRVKES